MRRYVLWTTDCLRSSSDVCGLLLTDVSRTVYDHQYLRVLQWLVSIFSKSIVRKSLLLVQLCWTTVFQSSRDVHVLAILSNTMPFEFCSSMRASRYPSMLRTRLYLLFTSRCHVLRLSLPWKYLLSLAAMSQWRGMCQHLHDSERLRSVRSLNRLSFRLDLW